MYVTHFAMRMRREQGQAALLTRKYVLFPQGGSGDNTFCLATRSWQWPVAGFLVTDLIGITDNSNSSNRQHKCCAHSEWRLWVKGAPFIKDSGCIRHSSPFHEKRLDLLRWKGTWYSVRHQIIQSGYNCCTCFVEDLNLSTLPGWEFSQHQELAPQTFPTGASSDQPVPLSALEQVNAYSHMQMPTSY